MVDQIFAYATNGATPVYMWIVLAIGAIAIMICAFIQKIRYDNGSINPERLVFSLVGAVINGFVAYLSLVVDVPTGSATHTLYNGGGIPAIFAIFTFLCFLNFVYSIRSPEILMESDEKEMGQQRNNVKDDKKEEEQ